jgi:hypothetical protein
MNGCPNFDAKYKYMRSTIHSFHIPVLGLAFSIDTPIKVAKYGIHSVVSLADDQLIEDARAYYARTYGLPYQNIAQKEEDYRAKRITAYLNMMQEIVANQIVEIKNSALVEGSLIMNYLELLDEKNALKILLNKYLAEENQLAKIELEDEIKCSIYQGDINVNIMTKLDKPNPKMQGSLPAVEYSDALAALRGFANSRLSSSVVFSAGFNPRLYSYVATFDDFFPATNGFIAKKIILKVSDFRSAIIQGKYLAKKGIWISEFRVESGLNCGGHAFPTEGYLMGPILEEFKDKRDALRSELYHLCLPTWMSRDIHYPTVIPAQKITVQGGIGTANEHNFLLDYYEVDGTGWGTPFLLVPEATNVDKVTLDALIAAREEDLYLSQASPLGVPFNNLRDTASEQLLRARIKAARPGSPCIKKVLVSNREFTAEPICTGSRQYENLKLKQLDEKENQGNDVTAARETVLSKACLCEDLAAPFYINSNEKTKLKPHTAICPGPNLAYFSGTFSLKQMVGHIYGRTNILNTGHRPNMFMNELKMYIDYLANEVNKKTEDISSSWYQHLNAFKINIKGGIEYYKDLIPQMEFEGGEYVLNMWADLMGLENRLGRIMIPAGTVEAI